MYELAKTNPLGHPPKFNIKYLVQLVNLWGPGGPMDADAVLLEDTPPT